MSTLPSRRVRTKTTNTLTDAEWYKKHNENTFIIGKSFLDFARSLELKLQEAERQRDEANDNCNKCWQECIDSRVTILETKPIGADVPK